MKKWMALAFGALAAASVGSAAQADITTLTVSGVFDTTWDTPSGGNLLSLVGKPYTMSFTFGDWSKNYRTDVHWGGTPVNSVTYYFNTNSSLTLPAGTVSGPGGPVLARMDNNVDGPDGVDIMPGTYDRLNLVGWMGIPGAPGYQFAIEMQIFGTTDFMHGISRADLGNLDWSQARFANTDLRLFYGPELVGDAGQDPPISYHDGVLSGDNMGVSFAVTSAPVPVPEPATWAMMLLGFGGLGSVLRSRRKAALAA
jgi:hypothetical protein